MTAVRLSRLRLGASVVAFAGVTGCTQPVPNGDTPRQPDASTPAPDQQQQDWAAIEGLEQEARAIVRTTGCSSAQACRTAPVGNRACGGPRYYLVYCAATTDSAALYRKLSDIVAAENAYNRKYGIVSTCEFRMAPDVVYAGGECRAR